MGFLFNRTQFFVHRGIQLRFARFVIVFVFLASLVTGLTVFYTTITMLGEKLVNVYPQGQLVEIFRAAHLALLLVLTITLPFVFYFSIVFSHRVVGPLPKIYRILSQIGKGDFEVNLVLRKKDELKQLAAVINQMAKDLKERESKK